MKLPFPSRDSNAKGASRRQPGEFGIADLERACPGVSRDMNRLRLRDLKAAGRIECLGCGPVAKWRKRVIAFKDGH
jgi:hypothetical protein